MSKIEWTDETWNPMTGCTKISPGCANCYAERITKNLEKKYRKYRNGFTYTEHQYEVIKPLKWKSTKKIFVNSMSDMFHEHASKEFISELFHVMLTADWHVYQILTKRPERMREFSEEFYKKYKMYIPYHIWLGTSVENQDYLPRIDELRNVKCNMRFVSFEPLIAPIRNPNMKGVEWAIIGGESGPNARPIEKSWVINLINDLKAQNVKVFFKQWGGKYPTENGREIDGKTYSEYPSLGIKRDTIQTKLI